MAINIEQWQIDAWARNVMILAQQMTNKLSDTVMMGDGMVPPAREKTVDIIDASDGEETLGSPPRFQVTGNVPTTETRRWIERRTFRWPKLVDRHDQLQVLHQLNNVYARLAAASWGRYKDRVIIGNAGINPVVAFTDLRGGLLGQVNQGNDTKVLQLFPAAQVIADGATFLTKTKIIQARQILAANDYDEGMHGPLFFSYHGNQLLGLLSDTSLTTIEQVAVKALMSGMPATGLLGFNWILCNRLPKVGSIRRNIAWARNAAEFAVWEEQFHRLTERDDLNYTPQLYMESVCGCSRGDDKLVVAVDVDETAVP